MATRILTGYTGTLYSQGNFWVTQNYSNFKKRPRHRGRKTLGQEGPVYTFCCLFHLFDFVGSWSHHAGPFLGVRGPSSCGRRLSRARGTPAARPGIEPTRPALEGGSLTTGPPGKVPLFFNYRCCSEAASLLTWQQVYKHTAQNAWRGHPELLAVLTSRGVRSGFRDTRERRGNTTPSTLGLWVVFTRSTHSYIMCACKTILKTKYSLPQEAIRDRLP